MKDSNKKRVRKFSIISIIFIAFCLIIFGGAIIQDIIYMIMQNGMSGEALISIIFYVPIVLFLVFWVFLAKRELEKHEHNAEMADKIAREYEKTESDDIENK